MCISPLVGHVRPAFGRRGRLGEEVLQLYGERSTDGRVVLDVKSAYGHVTQRHPAKVQQQTPPRQTDKQTNSIAYLLFIGTLLCSQSN